MDGLMMPPPANHAIRERSYTQTRMHGYAKSRAAFGPASARASYSERLHPRNRDRALAPGGPQSLASGTVIANRSAPGPPLFRSNSSLELEQAAGSALRREFGSHGSIDAIAAGDASFAVLTEFRSLDPELAAAREAARHTAAAADATETAADASPRLRSRLQRLWDRDRRSSRKGSAAVTAASTVSATNTNAESSLFRKLRGGGTNSAGSHAGSSSRQELETSRSSDCLDSEARLEERRRRRALVHYDCQSVLVSLSAVASRRGQLLTRKNTATGASAASSAWRAEKRREEDPATAQGADPAEEEDRGDERSNDLVLSCPYFRNELGGERERALHADPAGSRRRRPLQALGSSCPEAMLHRPAATCGLSVLEQPRTVSHWPDTVCPFSRNGPVIEESSTGSFYYKDFFHGREHENWVGMDEQLGPVAISVRRDQLETPAAAAESSKGQRHASLPCYRLIVRSSEIPTIRGLILEESLCHLVKSGEKTKRLPVREILDHVAPELQPSCLRLAVPEPRTEDYLMKLDQQYIFNRYKVGIMYCRAGQGTEEEMYNNEESGPALEEFLEMLGQRVRLKGFDRYKAGLDNKTDTTGEYSVYVKHQENEIMFHVSTLLQFSPNNRQQLLRKRYIGNDIVTIIFQEPGALPFSPKHIRSQFQHVFIVVRAVNPCTDHTQYSVAVNRFRDVPPFGPPIPDGATFPKSPEFAEFLYAKVINAENAAYQSDKFITMAKRTRQEYLKDLAANYLTETTLDAPQKFSIMSFSSRKKDRMRPRFNPDLVQRGAISWQVTVDDQSLSKQVDCVLGVSADSLALLEESSGALLFAAPAASVLGWTLQGTSLRVYFHLGECVSLHPRTLMDTEELAEIAARLSAVTCGSDTQELVLRRNAMGQLGFHVQSDGLVTEVETYSPAWQAGLRQGARLVEICKMAVCSMGHDQMVDLLKTSVTVQLAVLPPGPDGGPRRGCCLASCGAPPPPAADYENVPGRGETAPRQPACRQQPAARAASSDQRLSPPPPSVVSSGYGTGGSGRHLFKAASVEAGGTLSSSSSGSAERWTDEAEAEAETQRQPAPPPLPARHRQRLAVSHSLELVAPPGGQTANYAAPVSLQPQGAEQTPQRESLAYIELTSMNCGILMEAKNSNSKSTYLTDSGVDDCSPIHNGFAISLESSSSLQSPAEKQRSPDPKAHRSPSKTSSASSSVQSSKGHAQLSKGSNQTSKGAGSSRSQSRSQTLQTAADKDRSTQHDGAVPVGSWHNHASGPGRRDPSAAYSEARRESGCYSSARHAHRAGSTDTVVSRSSAGRRLGGAHHSASPVIWEQRPVGARRAGDTISRAVATSPRGLGSGGGSQRIKGGRLLSQQEAERNLRGRAVGSSRSSTDLSGACPLSRLSYSGSDQCLNVAGIVAAGSNRSSPLSSVMRSKSNHHISAGYGFSPNLSGSQSHHHLNMACQGGGLAAGTQYTRAAASNGLPGGRGVDSPLARMTHMATNTASSGGSLTGSQQSISGVSGCSHDGSGDPLLVTSRSEDELSARSLSPSLRRRPRAEACSRSQTDSPRPADTRLRGMAGGQARRASSGATLQSDFCNLIETSVDGLPPSVSERAGSSESLLISHRGHPPELTVTTARPAQGVLPVAPPGRWMSRAAAAAALSVAARAAQVPLPPGQVDWEALVDTATRAVGSDSPIYRGGSADSGCEAPAGSSIQAAAEGESDELKSRLTALENELVSEQSKRERLESQVQKLSSDNRRLQEESKIAAQQLRKFTEWFFRNVEKP